MSLKVNLGLSKKTGQPNFGSLGASCHVEFELDGSYDNGSSEHFQDAARRAYLACRQAVEAEIASHQSNGDHAGGQHAASSTNGSSNGSANGTPQRNATSSQVRAIHAIANLVRADLPGLLKSQFGVSRPEDLSIGAASTLIDKLKRTKGSTDTVPR